MASTTTTKPVALVVGASRGIGRQVAIDLAANGYAGMSIPVSRSDRSLSKNMQTPLGLNITTYTKLSPSFYILLYSYLPPPSETSNIKPLLSQQIP